LQSRCHFVNRGSVFANNLLFAAASLFAALLILLSEAVATDEDDEATIEFHGPAIRPGYPDPFSIGYILRKNKFSGYNVVINIKRKTLVFLFKTLLPLLLLVLVVYVTLYFPVSLTKERLTIAISAMLASAVLLTAINTQLTDVGYTTAIEYGFYAFFGLCLFCVVVGLMTERLHSRKNPALADRFDVATRILYPIITVGVFAYYYFRYF
jgi:hypothetical protein